MQIKETLKKAVLGSWRQKLTSAASVVIVYIVMLTGIFSYFHSEDVVTNKFVAQNAAVKLLEPEWDAVGHDKAMACEPGMIIPKNPYAKNEGQYDLYIRLKMTVALGRFDASGRSPEYAADFDDNIRRLNSILNVIKMKNGSNTSPLFSFTEGNLNSDCHNNDYYMENTGIRTLNDGTAEQVLYFYYVNTPKNGDSSEMRIVKPQEKTAELFDQLEIPVLKKDYLGVFDQSYDIKLEAQAVTVNPTESAAVSVQKNNFSE